ncbi:glycerophosphodiester phosphodiesterase [Erythrobacter sp. 3-20A1M]|uniref:glycerophosphodiester phosphodiesterase family protein n=1 Tax=Erythrobacter sp. 3-20A1M TaxID=2653850 RepID=UPI001BFC1C3E|nr:glycerophosphodiester phosphodiesterase family protein [Erythrobacter sp. 3-20A1M]QWC56953.1 glycerophosphodiester phosphodiesterase [Erythrobacter sp. 3-20A1M]
MRLSLFTPIDRRRAPPPAPGIADWLGQWAYAHRGLHGEGRVENSLSAFRAAVDAGYGIECDIQRSRDGRAMVFHDWELDRLTGQRGPVAARTADELAAIGLTGGGDTIPTLDTVLGEIAGRVPLLIEIKSRRGMPVVPVCRAVRTALEGYRGPFAVMSFDPRIARWFAAEIPGMPHGLVVTEENARGVAGTWRRHAALWHAKPAFLAYDIRDLPSAFAAAQRARGLGLLTWTVRGAAQRAVAEQHCDAPIFEQRDEVEAA